MRNRNKLLHSPNMALPFQDTIVWITGASSGIGRALAKQFARYGAKLAITSRTHEDLVTLQEEIQSKCPESEVLITKADVTDIEDLTTACKNITTHFQRLDLVIANAGNHIPSDPLNFDADQYKKLMEVNYFGLLHTLQTALPLLRKSSSPRIVGISSLAGFRGLPTSAAYGASKAAITNFLESARFHLEDGGIQTTIVHPGFVKTPLTDKNDFPMPFLIDAEKAAKIICTGIDKGKDEIAFPIPLSCLIKALQFVPYPLYKYLIRTFVWKPYQRTKK